MFLTSVQLSTGWSDWFSDEGVILVGSVRVNPRNLIGPSGRKKPSFCWDHEMKDLNLEEAKKKKAAQSRIGLRAKSS